MLRFMRVVRRWGNRRTRARAGGECGNNYESYFTRDKALLCGALVNRARSTLIYIFGVIGMRTSVTVALRPITAVRAV